MFSFTAQEIDRKLLFDQTVPHCVTTKEINFAGSEPT
jgi:hypothetical protein